MCSDLLATCTAKHNTQQNDGPCDVPLQIVLDEEKQIIIVSTSSNLEATYKHSGNVPVQRSYTMLYVELPWPAKANIKGWKRPNYEFW